MLYISPRSLPLTTPNYRPACFFYLATYIFSLYFIATLLMKLYYTKCFYRRMFPSMRIAISGLDNDQNYCVLLEMVPIADCRFKFSGSQWVPAGGAEPQSLQNIFIHPDSPALGSHWQAQPINFNKVKLTNNTLDSNGHVSIITRLSLC